MCDSCEDNHPKPETLVEAHQVLLHAQGALEASKMSLEYAHEQFRFMAQVVETALLHVQSFGVPADTDALPEADRPSDETMKAFEDMLKGA